MTRRTWLIALAVCFLASVGLYGAAVLPYHPPWNNPTAATQLDAPTSALRVLVNQPEVSVRSEFTFNMFPEPDALTAWADISFLNVPNPDTFRWILAGTGRMRFESRSVPVPPGVDIDEHFEGLPDFEDAYENLSPDTWFPESVRSCDTRFDEIGSNSVFYGGLGYATQIASNGWQPLAAQNLTAKLIFPEIVAETDLTSASWSVGTVGDTSRTVVTGVLSATASDCVDVDGEQFKPTATPLNLTVGIGPGMKAAGYKPVEFAPSGAVEGRWTPTTWTSDKAITISARFESSTWVKLREALVFSAGIVGGIFASLLVAGIAVRSPRG